MPLLLQLDSSADLTTSRTRALTRAVTAAWLERGDDYAVSVRDLHTDPLPHLLTPAQHWPEHLRNGEVVPADAEALQQSVIDQLLAADAVVIGAPMYNYAMPSTLKAWIDLIHVPGVTASFGTPTQPMAGRPAIIVTARGATNDTDANGDVQEDPVVRSLRMVLGGGLGMIVHVVATTRTLVDRVPALDAELAAAEFATARDEAARLALIL